MDDDIYDKIKETMDKIEMIYLKYKDDPYMIIKTHSFICNQLPNVLENMRQNYEERTTRLEEVNKVQKSFIETFLNNNQYFYLPSTEKYFYYDGEHYQLHSEDKILHQILTTITRDRTLMTWKQRTKQDIMKRIKQNNLFSSIPESATIQYVLDLLCPTFFKTRNETKYFLTILGDNILKSANTSQHIHFVNNKAKKFIKELNDVCQYVIGVNLNQTIKYKYHAHEYSNCRLIKMNEAIKCENLWSPMIKSALDIICVACHYSKRFTNSDNFVNSFSNDGELKKFVFYLKNTTQEDIVKIFTNEYLQLQNSGNESSNNNQLSQSPPNMQIILTGQTINIRSARIECKDMFYLWKHFLDSKSLPSIIFQNTLKTLLITELSQYYNQDLDTFVGISSKYLPDIQQFLEFWNTTIEIDETETEFEIEEMVVLFKKWCENQNQYNISVAMSDKQVLDLISFFFPTIEIERDKYINGIRCNLWNKQEDIYLSLEQFKQQVRQKLYVKYANLYNYEDLSSPLAGNTISIYDAYNYYCQRFSSIPNKLIVGKSYFEKYVFNNLYEYVIDSKFISIDWVIY
uniref:Uncharacterized protein n=1 Tax=viral metagenome TaxID=1070528 RepID=A0A6C0DQM9_9ZZZZ